MSEIPLFLTPEEIRVSQRPEILALLRAGQKPKAIVAALGVSYRAVYSVRKQYGLKPTYPRRVITVAQHAAITAALQQMPVPTVRQIAATLHVSRRSVIDVRKSLQGAIPKGSTYQAAQRRDRVRAMVADGHTSDQIGAALGISLSHAQTLVRRLQLPSTADRVVGRRHRLSVPQMAQAIALDAEHLMLDLKLIVPSQLSESELLSLIVSLRRSQSALADFTRQLVKEQQRAENAQPSPVESAPGPDQSDAHPPGAGDAAAVPPDACGHDRGESGPEQVGLPDHQPS